MTKKMKEGVDERMTEFFGGKKDKKDKSCPLSNEPEL